MATFLDVSGLSAFSSIFVFIFVWLVVYAMLAYTKFLGNNIFVPIIIGFLIAIFVLISPVATGLIAYIAPWIGIIFLFTMFIGIILKTFGATGAEIKTFAPLKTIFFVVIAAVVLIGALNFVRVNTGIEQAQEDIDDGNADFSKTSNFLLHPTMLGVIFVLLISVFTIALLVGFNR